MLLDYGPDLAELRRLTANYVVQTSRGTSSGELPLEQQMHFKFSLNLKTAAALGVTISPLILARADDVIE
jgi:putative ABC transport system substrate-binding protein